MVQLESFLLLVVYHTNFVQYFNVILYNGLLSIIATDINQLLFFSVTIFIRHQDSGKVFFGRQNMFLYLEN